VADGADDLSEVMSSYYSYFAASISYTGARWILYNDFATGGREPESNSILFIYCCFHESFLIDFALLCLLCFALFFN
jgi:hypothetical protein